MAFWLILIAGLTTAEMLPRETLAPRTGEEPLHDLVGERPQNYHLPVDSDGDVQKNVRTLLDGFGWTEVNNSQEAQLVWLWGDSEKAMANFGKTRGKRSDLWKLRLFNQIWLEDAMINKAELVEYLKEYNSTLGDNAVMYMRDVHPLTYIMGKQEECQEFFDNLPDVEYDYDHPWVRKQGHKANGRGIEIITNLGKLRKESLNEDGTCKKLSSGVVMQKYIRNPLLLNGHKCEIRMYWVYADMDPLQIFLFSEGTVRLNAEKFTMDDFDNSLIHVTNVEAQKAHWERASDGALSKEDWKWTFARFEDHLVAEGQVEKGWLRDTFLPEVKGILAFCINATRHQVVNDPAHFGLYGIDIILDSDLKPHMTELQFGPSLESDSETKKKVIPKMLKEAINIPLEIRERKLLGLPLSDLKSVKAFQVVIDEAQDPPFYFA